MQSKTTCRIKVKQTLVAWESLKDVIAFQVSQAYCLQISQDFVVRLLHIQLIYVQQCLSGGTQREIVFSKKTDIIQTKKHRLQNALSAQEEQKASLFI